MNENEYPSASSCVMPKALVPPQDALLSSLRAVAAQLIAAKQAGGETSQLASDGSALLMEMRRQEHAVLEAMEGPLQEVSAAKRKMEAAEAELHGLRYHKKSCVRGLAECNEMSLDLPVGLVSEAELKQLAPELVLGRGCPDASSAHPECDIGSDIWGSAMPAICFHYAPHTIRRPVELIMRDIAVQEEARAAKLDKEVSRLFPR